MKDMTDKERLLLRINHFLFKWYYKRCGDHFRQWTFIKSVKMLISNYDHLKLMYENELSIASSAMKEADKERQERIKLQVQMTASKDQIDWANDTFGTDFNTPDDN